MTEVIMGIITDILMVVVTVGAGFLVAWLKKKLGVEKLRKIQQESELVKEVVKAGVEYAEQRFNSGEKLDKASAWIAARLGEKGIIVSQDEIEGLIESTLRQFKNEFGENWGKEVNDKK